MIYYIIQSLFNKFQQKKLQQILAYYQCLHWWRAGQAHCDCGGSVHQHRGCSRSVGRGNPFVASPSPSESPHRSESWGVMGRHGASWGVKSCREAPTWYFVWFHCVSFKNSMVVYVSLHSCVFECLGNLL